MRVLIVNTSEKTGGAAVAARRLLKALVDNGVKAKMLVRDIESEDIKVVGLPGGWRRQWNFRWERACSAICISAASIFSKSIWPTQATTSRRCVNSRRPT